MNISDQIQFSLPYLCFTVSLILKLEAVYLVILSGVPVSLSNGIELQFNGNTNDQKILSLPAVTIMKHVLHHLHQLNSALRSANRSQHRNGVP